MADGVAITAGSGTTVLTDDCGASGHAQGVKLAVSADGAATFIPADATNGLDVDVTRVQGTVTVSPMTGLTSTLSNVAASTSSVNLLASNASRRSVTIVNDSTSVLYVKEGTTASATSYTWRLQSYDTLILEGAHTGAIDAIWVSANGAARITERA